MAEWTVEAEARRLASELPPSCAVSVAVEAGIRAGLARAAAICGERADMHRRDYRDPRDKSKWYSQETAAEGDEAEACQRAIEAAAKEGAP